MKLWTKEMDKILEKYPLNCENKIVVARYFSLTGWTWYVTEASREGNDITFFGYVNGFEGEWGYFTLGQLEECGYMIERDLYMQEGMTVDEYLKYDGISKTKKVNKSFNDMVKSMRKSEDFDAFVDSLDESYYGMNGRYEMGVTSNPMVYYYSAGLDEVYEIAIAFDTQEVTLSEPDMEMKGWVAIASEYFSTVSDISGIVMRLTGRINKGMKKSVIHDFGEFVRSLDDSYYANGRKFEMVSANYPVVYYFSANIDEYYEIAIVCDDSRQVILSEIDPDTEEQDTIADRQYNDVSDISNIISELSLVIDNMGKMRKSDDYFCELCDRCVTEDNIYDTNRGYICGDCFDELESQGDNVHERASTRKSIGKKDGLRKSAEWVEEGGTTYTWLTSKMGDLKFTIDIHGKTPDGMVYYEIQKLSDDGNYYYFTHGKCNTIEEAQLECERYMNEPNGYCDVCNTYNGNDLKHVIIAGCEELDLCESCYEETAECWFCHDIYFKDELNRMADGDDYLCENCYQALISRGEEVDVLRSSRKSIKKHEFDAVDDIICEYLQNNGPSTMEEIASDEFLVYLGINVEPRLRILVDMGEITYDGGLYSSIYLVEKSHKVEKGRGIVNLTIDNLLHNDFYDLDRYMRSEWGLHCTGYETEMTPSQLNNVVEAIRIYEMDEDLWEHHTANRGNGNQWDAGESISLDIQADLSFDQSFPNNEVLVYQDRRSWKTIIVQMKFYAYSEDLEMDSYSEDYWVTASTRKTKRRMR